MTKDSICKDCRWQKHIVCQSEGMESLCATQELTSCKQMVNGDMSDEVRVLECSEFEGVEMDEKIRSRPNDSALI